MRPLKSLIYCLDPSQSDPFPTREIVLKSGDTLVIPDWDSNHDLGDEDDRDRQLVRLGCALGPFPRLRLDVAAYVWGKAIESIGPTRDL